jgi:plasmid stability protein
MRTANEAHTSTLTSSASLYSGRSGTADIVLRNLEDDLKERLRLRAASNQRSMNAELREVVSAALTQPRRGSLTDLKKLAVDIRSLSAGRRQTPAEDLLRDNRDQR